MKKSILIIDDDKNILRYLKDALEEKGYAVIECAGGDEGIRLYENHKPFLVLTDLRMAGMDGLGVIEKIIRMDSKANVIMMTGYASVETAVEAMKRGARDYLSKPFDVDDLLGVIEHWEEKDRSIVRDPAGSEDEVEKICREQGLLSDKMKGVFKTLLKVAKTDATVLITGESGVGKELKAKLIHRYSPRKEKPFVPVDCGSLPDALLESELFGHMKGSFTGAHENHMGLFESASGGTLFLDEIGNVSVALQAKLLRALQERVIKPVGSTKERPVDIRVVVATNKNLRWEVDQGNFRKDLYYRLDVITLKVPALRERPEDILSLARHFIKEFAEKGYPGKKMTAEAESAFKAYGWPGNVRELKSAIEKLMTLLEGDMIRADDFSREMGKDISGMSFKAKKEILIENFEKENIEKVLKQTSGNVSEAARILEMSRKSLYQKMKEMDIRGS